MLRVCENRRPAAIDGAETRPRMIPDAGMNSAAVSSSADQISWPPPTVCFAPAQAGTATDRRISVAAETAPGVTISGSAAGHCADGAVLCVAGAMEDNPEVNGLKLNRSRASDLRIFITVSAGGFVEGARTIGAVASRRGFGGASGIGSGRMLCIEKQQFNL